VALAYPSKQQRRDSDVAVVWMQTRRLAEREAVPVSLLRWSRTRLVPASADEEDLWLYRKDIERTRPFGGALSGFTPPDLAFIVDSSASMKWEPGAGRGEYDLLLRTIYSVWLWLERRGVASYLRYAAINFSNETVFSGWHPWHHLRPVKEILFGYQGGSTCLDPQGLYQLSSQAVRQCAAILITDGRVNNWRQVVEAAHSHRRQGHFLTFIQVGAASPLFDALEKDGFETRQIRSARALPDLVLGEVQRRFAPR
jgi:hypothetical protein